MNKAVGRVGLALGGVAFALLLGECGVRALGVTPERHRQPRTIENADKTAAIDAYPSNPRGDFDLDLRDDKTRARLASEGIDVSKIASRTPYAVEFHYNAHRCRDRDLDPTPKAGTTRVLVLGDSFTEGQGVREQSTFPRILERELTAAGKNVEVLDCGRRGRDFPALHDAFVELVGAYHPNVVVYAMVLNDAEQSDEFRSRQKFMNDWILDRRRMLADDDDGEARGSRLYALWRERTESRRVARETTRWYLDVYGPENAAGWSATQRYIADMRAQMNGKFLVALLPLLAKGKPYPFEPAAKEIARAMKAADVAFVDLEPAIANEPAESLWVHAVDMHPNERAHSLFAKSLVEPVLAQIP
ncbi:MAG TPA: GDSL-type esterase/lipase family protein [Polyangiaceae bacterium]